MGRRKKNIDEAEVARLAYEGNSNSDIARLVGCDEGTIRGRFSEIVHKERARRRRLLRQLQTNLAASGNATMLIWLGKNELDQVDEPEATIQVGGTGPTTFKVTIGGKQE